MTWIVHLYREGGEHDAESFACGPFGTLEEAQENADALTLLGTATELFLFADASVVERNAL